MPLFFLLLLTAWAAVIVDADGDTISGASAASLPYETRWYDQTLDHFQLPLSDDSRPSPSAPPRRWRQRYLINDDYFGRPANASENYEYGLPWPPPGRETWLTASCPGPILLYTGNEGDIAAFWGANGFMHRLAATWGGLILFPEERYYGQSIPSEEVRYLSTEQVLEDYVELLGSVKRGYGAKPCPAVAFGGSYGGSLATFLRATRPLSVVGALAASAPVGYYDATNWEGHGVDGFTWAELAARAYRDAAPGGGACLEAIWAAARLVDDAVPELVMDAFQFCDDRALKPDQSSTFLYALESLPQQNYPYEIGPMPAWPVSAVCSIMTNAHDSGRGSANDLVLAAAAATSLAMGFSDDSGRCIPTPNEGPGNVPGDGPGKGSWGYQSCTETLHMFSSHGSEGGGLRQYSFDLQGSIEICKKTWGADAIPDVKKLSSEYGGYKLGDGLTNITNIIWSLGELDPWSGGCFRSSHWIPGEKERQDRSVHFLSMPNGAHHLDLRGDHPADPTDIRATRKIEEKILWGWIEDWRYEWEAAASVEMGVSISAMR